MQISPSFTLLLLIATSVLSISVYSFSRGSVSNSSKTRHRKLNKIESLILIPFAAVYHLLAIKILTETSEDRNLYCFFSKSFEFAIGENGFVDFILNSYPQVNTCIEIKPITYAGLFIGYYVIYVLVVPYLIGRFVYKEEWFKKSPKNLVLFYEGSKFILNKTKKNYVIPIITLTIVIGSMFWFFETHWYLYIVLFSIVLFIKPIRNIFLLPLLATMVTLTVAIFFIWEVIHAVMVTILNLASLGLLQIIKDWISSSDIPEYLKDFNDKDFYYIVDATLTDGKMISGILRDFDYLEEQKKLEAIVLEKPVRWERFSKTEAQQDFINREIVNTGYYLKEKSIPGESFYIKTNSLIDMNTAKVPRNFIYFFNSSKAELNDDFIRKFKKWFKERHQKYIFSNIDIYLPASLANLTSEVRDLFPPKDRILGRLELFTIEEEEIRNFLKKAGLKKSEKYIIDCDVEKAIITSPYFEGKEAPNSILKRIFLRLQFKED